MIAFTVSTYFGEFLDKNGTVARWTWAVTLEENGPFRKPRSWARHDPDNGILKKIDRVLGNNCFMGNFPNAHAMFLPHLSSDRCPVVLFIPKMVRKKKKAFKFANFIAEKPKFLDIVKEGWNMEIEGCYMFKLVKKLKRLKPLLKNLSWKNGNLYERVNKWKGGASKYSNKEDSFLSQQAKIEWLKDGDKNSKFFHAVLKSRKHKSRVAAISNENGVIFEGEQVPEQFVSHFQKFLGSSFDVKEVGDDIIHEVRVSKAAANDMVQFCISKILTNRIKKALCKVVSPNQSAFIPGRQITDNILISQELLRVILEKIGSMWSVED
ncbi:hypothetical protein Tco_1059937 [Tanacetum coccineum]